MAAVPFFAVYSTLTAQSLAVILMPVFTLTLGVITLDDPLVSFLSILCLLMQNKAGQITWPLVAMWQQ